MTTSPTRYRESVKKALAALGAAWMTTFLVVAICVPARADEQLSPTLVRIASYAKAPVHIVYCSGRPSDVQWSLGADFVNASPKTATVVEIEFRVLDAFGSVLKDDKIQSDGTYPTGERVRQSGNAGGWTVGALRMPGTANVKMIECAISRVLFSDGSSWIGKGATKPTSPAVLDEVSAP